MHAYYATVPAEGLAPADSNPQMMKPALFKALRAAIREDDGLLDDPVVWKDGGRFRIVSGHHRIKALAEEGKPVQVKVIDDPAANELWYRRRVLSANRVHGDPDDEALRQFLLRTFEVTGVESADFFKDLGFSSQEVLAYMAQTDDYDLARAAAEDGNLDAAASSAAEMPPATIKQVSIFVPIGEYPEFMKRTAELMRMWNLRSVTDVVAEAIKRAYAVETEVQVRINKARGA